MNLFIVIGLLVLAIVIFVAYLWFASDSGSGSAPSFPPGTVGFEAQLELPLLAQAIAAREAKLQEQLEPARRQELEAELAQLQDKQRRAEAAIANRDTSPGKGYIGIDMGISVD
ncbi:MAG: hypothetical protein F6J87_09085 [Spirulina sp. SIO3F2]|nr:hypothetical protein [Spirulina sp. SIO3F2]